MSAPVFEIEWKGQPLGRFTLVELRARLASGQLSRLHRVQVQGAWQGLGAWLDQMEANQRQSSAFAQQQAEADSQRELIAERARATALEQRLQQQEHQLRRPMPSQAVQSAGHDQVAHDLPQSEMSLPYTSGLAVAALVFGILAALFMATCFILVSERSIRWLGLVMWCDTIAWLLAIIFGHLAMVEIRRDELARGQGLALTGLTLGYSVIALITFLLILGTLKDDYRHFLNQTREPAGSRAIPASLGAP